MLPGLFLSSQQLAFHALIGEEAQAGVGCETGSMDTLAFGGIA